MSLSTTPPERQLPPIVMAIAGHICGRNVGCAVPERIVGPSVQHGWPCSALLCTAADSVERACFYAIYDGAAPIGSMSTLCRLDIERYRLCCSPFCASRTGCGHRS